MSSNSNCREREAAFAAVLACAGRRGQCGKAGGGRLGGGERRRHGEHGSRWSTTRARRVKRSLPRAGQPLAVAARSRTAAPRRHACTTATAANAARAAHGQKAAAGRCCTRTARRTDCTARGIFVITRNGAPRNGRTSKQGRTHRAHAPTARGASSVACTPACTCGRGMLRPLQTSHGEHARLLLPPGSSRHCRHCRHTRPQTPWPRRRCRAPSPAASRCQADRLALPLFPARPATNRAGPGGPRRAAR